jgi:hypothetical protein
VTAQRTEAARVAGPVTGGRGWPFGSPPDVARYGCVIEEFLADGVAQSYAPSPGSEVGLDGRWSVEPAGTAGYHTRFYVVRPADPARFNGVVIVNWQNVTAGLDLGTPAPYDLEQGYAWVGVTTQRVAMEGQASLTEGMAGTKGLPAWDPERYGTLHHPGDAFSYDIFTQVARAVSPARPNDSDDPLGGLHPRLMIAMGGSQSAMRLGSYINIADDTERLFDAFLMYVHWGMCPYPPDQSLMESFTPVGDGLTAGSAAIHDRGRVPILVLCSESETMNNLPVRLPDSPSFRFWEMAGTAHAGGGVTAEMEEIMTRDGMAAFLQSDVVNTVDWGYVRNAALEHLVAWADGGSVPPSFPPVEATLAGGIGRDEMGNAKGGIRLPELLAPTAVHLGTNPINPLAALSGQSTPFSEEQLASLYSGADAYVGAWDTAVAQVREQRLVLDCDLEALSARGRDIATELWGAGSILA